MPHVWQVVVSVEVMVLRQGVEFSVDDLLYTYLLTRSRTRQYTLGKMYGRKMLVHNCQINDRGWWERFFFINSAFLIKDGLRLRSEWNMASMLLPSLLCSFPFIC